MSKTEVFQIRITGDDRVAFQEAADLTGQKVSEWARDTLRAAVPPIPIKDLLDTEKIAKRINKKVGKDVVKLASEMTGVKRYTGEVTTMQGRHAYEIEKDGVRSWTFVAPEAK